MNKEHINTLAKEFCEERGMTNEKDIKYWTLHLTDFITSLIEKGEVVELKEVNVSRLEKDMTHAHTDCRTSEGITVGLIDSLISVSRVLYHRLTIEPKYNNNDGRFIRSKAITEALRDLITDEDYIGIKNIGIHNSKKQ